MVASTLKATTDLSNESIGKQFNVSRETVRHVLDAAERDARLGRTRLSTAERRAEAREWLDQ
jgi:transposase